MPPLLRRTLPLLIATAVLLVMFRVLVPNFLATENLLDIIQQVSVNAILAFGMTLIILISGIDLSVGALVALVGTATTFALLPSGWHCSTPLAFAVGFAVALAFGLFHGFASAKTPMPPFIITLG